jgi:hypothetical protein
MTLNAAVWQGSSRDGRYGRGAADGSQRGGDFRGGLLSLPRPRLALASLLPDRVVFVRVGSAEATLLHVSAHFGESQGSPAAPAVPSATARGSLPNRSQAVTVDVCFSPERVEVRLMRNIGQTAADTARSRCSIGRNRSSVLVLRTSPREKQVEKLRLPVFERQPEHRF